MAKATLGGFGPLNKTFQSSKLQESLSSDGRKSTSSSIGKGRYDKRNPVHIRYSSVGRGRYSDRMSWSHTQRREMRLPIYKTLDIQNSDVLVESLWELVQNLGGTSSHYLR